MNCPISVKPTITSLRAKYPEFNYSWDIKKFSVIEKVLDKLDENATRLSNIKNVCKKHWNFESDCEYRIVADNISRLFTKNKSKYALKFSTKLPAIFSKVTHQPSVDQFVTKTTKKTVEKSSNVFFKTLEVSIMVSEENAEKALDFLIQLNKSSS